MHRKLLCIFAAFAVAFCLTPWHASGKVTKAVIMKTASGTAQQVTTDETILSGRITFHSKVGNAATVYVGGSTVSATNFYASLSAGGAYTISVSALAANSNDRFRLSDFYVLGTNPDVIAISYESRTTP